MSFSIYPLRSSSKGNAILVSDGSAKILIDCGVSGRALEAAFSEAELDIKEVSALVITHEHTDHIKGAGIFSRKYGVPVYANRKTWRAMSECVGKIADENIRIFETGAAFTVNGIDVTPFPIPHDAAEPVGYTFKSDTDCCGIATDMGAISETVFDAVKGCAAVLIEANYDINMLEMGPYPYSLKQRIKGKFGHLANNESARLCARLAENGAKDIILGHLSWENNYPEIAYQTVKEVLIDSGIRVGADVMLRVAQRGAAGFHECGMEFMNL